MKERRAILILGDLVLVNVAVLLALAVWALRGDKDFGAAFLLAQFYWFVALSAMWAVFAFLNGLYDLNAVASLSRTGIALLRTFVLVVLVYLAIYFLVPNELPRLVIFYHGVTTISLVMVWRALYSAITRRASFRRRALILGAGWSGSTIAATINGHLEKHYQVVGFIDDDPAKQKQTIGGVPVLGTPADLVATVKQKNIAEVILAVTHDLRRETFATLLDVQEQGVQITPMPLLYEEITGRVPVDHIGDSWYVSLPLGHAGTGALYPILKRALDIAVASVGLITFMALFPLIALAVRLDSPGAIFYTQERVGKGGRVFRVKKIRTMIADAERDGRAVWATPGDPRVTRVGRILRKLRIDEFPQFVNVLRGEMSVVGPRPERPEFVAQLEDIVPFYRLRHAVKPGMAGWAFLNAGSVDSVEDARVRVEYDLYYIKHQSIWLDILILFRTIGELFKLKSG